MLESRAREAASLSVLHSQKSSMSGFVGLLCQVSGGDMTVSTAGSGGNWDCDWAGAVAVAGAVAGGGGGAGELSA